MDQRDQELLDKQLRWLSPSRRTDGVLVLTIVAIFIAGISIGGTVFARESQTAQLVPSDLLAAASSMKFSE